MHLSTARIEFDQPIRLQRRTNCSFEIDRASLPRLVTWLQLRGYWVVPRCSDCEYGRLRKGGALVVLFNSGSILCQGADAQQAVQLLGELGRAA